MPIVLDELSGLTGPPDPDTAWHIAYPFTLTLSGVAVVEQDTETEVLMCCQAIVACPVGVRDELPAFGVSYPEFEQAPLDPDGVAAAWGVWEPRAQITADTFADLHDESFWHEHVTIGVRP